METITAEQEDFAPSSDLGNLWNALCPSRWIITALTSLAALVSSFYFYSLPDQYTATTQILIQPAGNYSNVSQPTSGGVSAEDLAAREEYDYYQNQLMILKNRRIASLVNSELGDAVPAYVFDAKRIKNTSIISITVTQADPETAAIVANKYAEVFAKENSTQQLFITEQLLKYVPEDLEVVGSGGMPGRANFPQANFFNKNLFAESIGNVMADPVIGHLREEKMGIEAKLDELRMRYRSEYPFVKETEGRLKNINERLQERNQMLLTNLRATLAGAVKIYNVQILEPAQAPTAPSGPNRFRGIFTATAGVFLSVCGTILTLKHLNQKVVSQKDLPGSLTFLGYVPFTKTLQANALSCQGSIVDLLQTDALLADMVANMRTHALFSMPYERSRNIMVTSTLAEEGKTTISIFLAASFAQLGRNILLIDADMRRPSVAKYLNISGQPLGLSDFLLGTATKEEIIQTVPQTTLRIVTAGSTFSPYAPELLSSQRFRELLEYATQAFDRVLIDSPPVLYIPDGLIIAKYVHTGILVCGANMIHKKVIDIVKKKFDVINFSVMGVVINRADYSSEGYYPKYDYKYYTQGSPGSRRTKLPGGKVSA